MKGIASDDIAAELFHLRGDGAVAVVLAVGFAPPDDPGIGLDAHEHEILAPAGMDWEAFELGNFHGSPAMVLSDAFSAERVAGKLYSANEQIAT